MWLLLLWLQTWHIPTAHKQIVRSLQVFSGHSQQAWVAYLSTRAGYTHLYVHLVDTSGYEPLGRGGLCLSCGEKTSVQAWDGSLSEKNVFILAWSTTEKTFLCEIDPEGGLRWKAEFGKPVQAVKVISHPEGGTVALFQRDSSLLLTFWDSRGQLSSQYELLPTSIPCRHARLLGGNIEGFLILWEAYTGSRWEIFFQKWLWQRKPDAPARPLSQFSHSVEEVAFIGDGFGGLLGVYESVSLSGAGKDLYLIRYNRSGNRLYEVPLCTEVGDQQAPRLHKRGSELLIIWEDNRRQDWDIYYQRVEITTGRPLLSSTGIPLVSLPGPQRNPQLILDYFQNEMLLLWEDQRRIEGDVYMQRYSADGKPLWDFAGKPISAVPLHEYGLRTAAQDFQFFWVAYLREEAESGTHPYIGLLTTRGEMRFHRRLAGNLHRPFAQVTPLAAFPWGDRLFLLWRDDRDSVDLPQLYAQLISPEGHWLWYPYGLPISPQPGLRQKSPQLYAQGDTLWLLWEGEESDVETAPFVQLLTPTGRKLFPRPIPICNADRVQTEARWLPLPSRLYAYWTDNRTMEETGFDLYLRSVSPLMPEVGWRVTRTFQNSAFLAFAKDTTLVHHLWQEEVNGKYQIAYALSPLGNVSNPTFLSPTMKSQRFLSALADLAGNLYATFCEEAPGPYEQVIRLFALSPEGQVRWQHTSPWGYKHHLYPTISLLPTGELLLLALGSPQSGRWELLYAIFHPSGQLRQKGTMLSPVPEQCSWQLITEGGAYWLLLRLPTGYTLYYGKSLHEMKPVKLPASPSEALLTQWRGQTMLFWSDREKARLSIERLSPAP